jgi:excinuclease ABC subunit C
MNLPDKIRGKLNELPDAPGCYLMRDRHGKIIYVGKAVSLRKRVRSYFRRSALRNAEPKLRGLIKSTRDIDYVVAQSEAQAVLTEGQLIKDYRPRYNISFKDDKRFLLLRADAQAPFPRFRVCRIKRDDGRVYFGPYASSHSARATLDFVEKRFGLRKCGPRMPDRDTHRHCLNDIIRYCAAPCIGRVTPEEYRRRFEEACAFLRGDRPSFLKELRGEMEAASSRLDFERAIALRDMLFHLQATLKQKVRLAATPEIEREEARAGLDQLVQELGLQRVPNVIEAFDISNISGTYSVAGMVCAVAGIPRRNRYRRFRIRTVKGVNDPAMIAEVIRRRFRATAAGKGSPPDLILVDGGIAQLRAARAELQALGVTDVAAAGLAKRLEQVYWRDSGPPLRLPRDSRALKVLQRIRDEAHRFALTYHRQLRRKRIRESVLDEIYGIGDKKKALVLKHFGSVRRLMQASQEDLIRVPGIGPCTAALIRRAIHGGSP